MLTLALSACEGGGDLDPDASLERAVLAQTEDGFALDDDASGPLDLGAAAEAGTQPPDQAREQLERLDVRAATVRVWTRGSEFHRVLAVRLTPSGAKEYVAAELAVLRATPAATIFEVPDPPGATGVLLAGQTRSAGRGVFCQSVLFPSQDVAFTVQTCSRDRPGAPDRAMSLAKAQATRVAVADQSGG